MSVESLTDEQAMFAMAQVGEWLRIKEQQKQQANSPDATHSSLLHWLLTGHEALDKPPPVVFSRPHHRLAMGETIRLDNPPLRIPGENSTLIAQSDQWTWIDPDQGLLKHKPSGVMYQYDDNEGTLRKVEVQVV